MSELFDTMFVPAEAGRATDGQAWVRAMLSVEAALARCQAAVSIIPRDAATAIVDACASLSVDPEQIGRDARASGSPVIPLLDLLRAQLPADVARFVHLGATSQDVLDTAAMLVARESLSLTITDLRSAADVCADLATRYRRQPITGRTLLQHAVPITFGFKAAGWMVALDDAARSLGHVRSALAVQLGGPAGTLSAVEDAPTLVELLAAELHLAAPTICWHTSRGRVVEIAGALAAAATAAAKVAVDIGLLMQEEVGELRLDAAAGGPSSAMPHKRNPTAAVLSVACARQAVGACSEILASAVHEHERAFGAWHAEWRPFRDALVYCGATVSHGRTALEHIVVDGDRMLRNLELRCGAVGAEQLAVALATSTVEVEAHRHVAGLVTEAEQSGRAFVDVARADDVARGALTPAALDAALNLERAVLAAAAFVDRALDRRSAP